MNPISLQKAASGPTSGVVSRVYLLAPRMWSFASIFASGPGFGAPHPLELGGGGGSGVGGVGAGAGGGTAGVGVGFGVGLGAGVGIPKTGS